MTKLYMLSQKSNGFALRCLLRLAKNSFQNRLITNVSFHILDSFYHILASMSTYFSHPRCGFLLTYGMIRVLIDGRKEVEGYEFS